MQRERAVEKPTAVLLIVTRNEVVALGPLANPTIRFQSLSGPLIRVSGVP